MSSTVKSFVLRKLNRNKAALLMAEARHAGLPPAAYNHGCPICHCIAPGLACSYIARLRKDVAAGEVALKQAEAMR